MVVYWDLVMLLNFLVDYLLLYSAMRLSGRDIGRKRLLLGALLGALYAVVQLLFPPSFFLMALIFLAIGTLSFYGSGRAIKMTLLFLMLSCAFGGAVLMLEQISGKDQLAQNVMYAELHWGVFFVAAGLSYLIFCVAFRAGAEQDCKSLVDVKIVCGEKHLKLRLLRDTGNILRDEQTNTGIPVISKTALLPFLTEKKVAQRYLSENIFIQTVGRQNDMLQTMCCDAFICNGAETNIRRIAMSDTEFGDSYVGVLPQNIGG